MASPSQRVGLRRTAHGDRVPYLRAIEFGLRQEVQAWSSGSLGHQQELRTTQAELSLNLDGRATLFLHLWQRYERA